MNCDAKNTQWQSQQPDQGIDHQCEQCDGPAQDEQNAPQEERSHGNLVRELSTINRVSGKLPRSLATTMEKPEKFQSLDIRSAEAVLQLRTESPHPGAYENHRFPSEGHAPRHESSREFGLQPAVGVWKA